jgi:hypothetical protein
LKWTGLGVHFVQKPLDRSYPDIGLKKTRFDIFDDSRVKLAPDQTP